MLEGRTGDVGRVMRGFASLATTEVRKVADERVQVRTGAYKRGISTKQITGDRVEVRAAAPHSIFLERGTRPHRIVPKRPSGWLVFPWKGQIVFSKGVNHPGTRPYRIIEDGVRRAGRQLNRLARR